MNNEICRALTFINYHIPLVLGSDIQLPYITMGFFDGMLTEVLEVEYEEKLKCLWKYSVKRIGEQLGQYSYQSIVCFSKDEWNKCSDEVFWKEDTNRMYPLTFVVFLQLRGYQAGEEAIAKQCMAFHEAVNRSIQGEGVCYVYNTIDKNDFVVCLKSRKYQIAVDAIKKLHMAGAEIVYSYSVFSVSRKVLSELDKDEFRYIFDEKIFSICLKGITNSYDLKNQTTLDRKYYIFCRKLVHELYDGKEKQNDFKIYDILGDDDFRLIARQVSLGKLLQQFAPKGLLSYMEEEFRFYLFSSSVVLNTKTPVYTNGIEKSYIEETGKKMKVEFQSPCCNQLQNKMKKISEIVSEGRIRSGEKVVTFCRAVWQLLQSLKQIETSPTKKYDFWSLYQPLSLMVDILEEKLEKAYTSGASEKEKDFINNEEIYNFIHKISMTLHGTLRTDIQFFQIRDFNVIVHYAPAKLRAFYSLWVFQLTDYYGEFIENGIKNKYSFILSPGMYREAGVKELYANYPETKRLMLITVPERHLYANQWFPVILSHEVSHYVGYAVRQREARHFACLKCCARVLFLEINSSRYRLAKTEWQPLISRGIRGLMLFEEMKDMLIEEEENVRFEVKKFPHEYHSKNSVMIIKKAFEKVRERCTAKLILEDTERLNIFLHNEKDIKKMRLDEQMKLTQELTEWAAEENKEIMVLEEDFESTLLEDLLKMLIYICKESYADLVAIFTLNLSPEEYIFSFSKGEGILDIEDVGDRLVVLLPIRAGHTMQAVMDAVKNKPLCFTEHFNKQWAGEIFKDLPLKFAEDSIEDLIAEDIYGYMTGIRDCNHQIEEYRHMNNYAKKDSMYNILDFLNDKAVWGYLHEYLKGCANKYVDFLSHDLKLMEMQKKLLYTYDKVARGSLYSMSQEIENFLSEYEEKKGWA